MKLFKGITMFATTTLLLVGCSSNETVTTNTKISNTEIEFVAPSHLESVQREDIEVFLEEISSEELPADLLGNVVDFKSGFDHQLIGPKGELGLMQISPEVAEMFGFNPYNPLENVRCGIEILNFYIEKFHGNVEFAIAANYAGVIENWLEKGYNYEEIRNASMLEIQEEVNKSKSSDHLNSEENYY